MKNTSRTSPCRRSGRRASSNGSVSTTSPASFSTRSSYATLPVPLRLTRVRLDETRRVESRRMMDEHFHEMDRLVGLNGVDTYDLDSRHGGTLNQPLRVHS